MIVDKRARLVLRLPSMITATIKDMAQRRGIGNASQLAREAQLHTVVAYRLWSGEFQRLDTQTLDRLCVTLRCQPGQLLKHVTVGARIHCPACHAEITSADRQAGECTQCHKAL